MSDNTADITESSSGMQKYSGKRGALKYLNGSFDGILSAIIIYAIVKFVPDINDMDAQYVMLVVLPTITGIPPLIRNWFKNHKLGRAITWYVVCKYNNILKKIFKGVPDNVIDGTYNEEKE